MSMTIPVTRQLDEAVRDIPGWTPLDQLLSLFTLGTTSAHLGGDILELGSWCGRSAVALAMAARISGGTVHCVDLFPERDDWYRNEDGSYSFSVTIGGRRLGAYEEQTVWAEPFERDIAPVYTEHSSTRTVFDRTMETNGLAELVRPVKGDLETFAQSAPAGLSLRMAFIDGDHSYAAVARDIAIVERFLLPGGWICFDDAFSGYTGVDQAIEEHIAKSGRYDLCQQLTRKFFIARRISTERVP
jgi:predicted O-methyltransferase YrrM